MSLGEQFETILPAAQRGAGWALEALYRDLAPAVVGYLRLQGAEDPEDLANEVFLGAFRGLAGFAGGEEALRSWVFSIAHRRIIDERRRRARRVSVVPLDAGTHVGGHPGAGGHAGADAGAGAYRSTGPGVEDQALGALEEERLRRVCESLAPDQRDVVLLRLVGDLSVEQTAAALGKRPGAVKALQHRGLEALRRILVEEISAEGVSG